MTAPARASRGRGWRRGRGVGARRHDAYALDAKIAEPAFCKTCGAVVSKGRWTWGERAVGARRIVCPACRRIRDGYPAGRIAIEGLPRARRREILALLRNVEKLERAEHPLERLIEIVREEDAVHATTTGTHLARRIARALQRAWSDEVRVRYVPADDLVRVVWKASEH